jgi:hypothetical protein
MISLDAKKILLSHCATGIGLLAASIPMDGTL